MINIYAPGAPQYTRQTLKDIKEETDINTIIAAYFNTPTYTNGQIIKTEN